MGPRFSGCDHRPPIRDNRDVSCGLPWLLSKPNQLCKSDALWLSAVLKIADYRVGLLRQEIPPLRSE